MAKGIYSLKAGMNQLTLEEQRAIDIRKAGTRRQLIGYWNQIVDTIPREENPPVRGCVPSTKDVHGLIKDHMLHPDRIHIVHESPLLRAAMKNAPERLKNAVKNMTIQTTAAKKAGEAQQVENAVDQLLALCTPKKAKNTPQLDA